MKNILLVIVLFISITSYAQTPDDVQIKKLLDEQTMAWNKGDIDGFMKGYWENDSLMFVGKNGITYGWENTRKNYKKNYPDFNAMGKLTFDILVVKKLSKKYYEVIGKWFLKRNIGDIGGLYTLLFKKINNHWVIILDHSS